ncbi:hypothetical protein Cob_v004319 [Colletotrichum orbiculare MAFF 240422]|uniref:Uncharacterized protein n=1 Tax=Colletotrichum orbiculare (strain 104-T / ATCC 96160 / CBS 514.97 / LARS 414 / MAFF 240422) TaxID=1213857 RepID=A0A484FYT4_COLOR|nr:hypothetical protein Cob_v004319 [Colletotrichum orbiculare MAFF 240422]
MATRDFISAPTLDILLLEPLLSVSTGVSRLTSSVVLEGRPATPNKRSRNSDVHSMDMTYAFPKQCERTRAAGRDLGRRVDEVKTEDHKRSTLPSYKAGLSKPSLVI